MTQKTAILFNTKKTGYSVNQVLEEKSTLTVQELIDYLSDFDPNSPILFSNDDGYTFGELNDYTLDEIEIDNF